LWKIMALLDEQVRTQVKAALAEMPRPVKMLMFTQREGGALECANCGDTRNLAQEVSELSDRIALEVRDFVADEELAKHHGVDKIPAIVLLGAGAGAPRDHGIRFFGMPAGYEFSTLIEDLRMVSSGDPKLSPATMKFLAGLKEPVHIQVFVTPT
jgi:alkyl hydroperoxide reductase subunit AhpF